MLARCAALRAACSFRKKINSSSSKFEAQITSLKMCLRILIYFDFSSVRGEEYVPNFDEMETSDREDVSNDPPRPLMPRPTFLLRLPGSEHIHLSQK
ncbi:hypothetical protein J6590_052477 [Homalodisca vitripennis]|nr:hypothetical protein J6590_052477 [Homalodisca vitripennis]